MDWTRQFGGPRIAGGDFNSYWGEWWIRQMETEWTDTWQDVTGSDDNGHTLNGVVRFDYLLDRLEALPLQRRLQRVPDARFDFALPIGIAHATRQADHPVVREHVAIERIEGRLVDVGRENALFEIIEEDHARRPARRRNARSWSSAHACAPECHTRSRTALREKPSVRTNSRVRRYLAVCECRTIGPSP